MKNFERYEKYTKEKYSKKGLSYFLMRRKSDEIIFPYLRALSGEKILEVGIGYGYYKNAYFDNNSVTGYDVNSNLGESLGIEIISGKADEIKKVGEKGRKFDRILSFFMTEYLNSKELFTFINDSIDYLLEDSGTLATTIIIDYGLGALYTRLAKWKKIDKYSYKYEDIKRMLEGRCYKIIPLNSYLAIPFAVLIEVKK